MFRKKKQSSGGPVDISDEVAVVEAVARRYPPGATVHFGAPTRCPGCGEFGMVDTVAAGRCANHCLRCGAQWELTHRAVHAYLRSRPTQPPAPMPMAAPAAPPTGSPEPVRLGSPSAPGRGADAPTGLVDLDLTRRPASPEDGVLRVLVVDDNAFDARDVDSALAPFGAGVVVHHALTRAEGERLARREPLHVVLLDLDLPDSTGFDTLLSWQRAVGDDLPVVGLLDAPDEHLVAQLRAMGVRTVVFRTHLRTLLDAPESGAERLARVLAGVAGRPVPANAPALDPSSPPHHVERDRFSA